MTIAFNVRYLADGIAAVDGEQVTLDVTDPVKPGMLSAAGDDSFRYLLMPVRV